MSGIIIISGSMAESLITMCRKWLTNIIMIVFYCVYNRKKNLKMSHKKLFSPKKLWVGKKVMDTKENYGQKICFWSTKIFLVQKVLGTKDIDFWVHTKFW